MKKKNIKSSIGTIPGLFDQEDHLATWAALKQEYKKAIIVIQVGISYFSYGNDAGLIAKYTDIITTGSSSSKRSCIIPSDKWHGVFLMLISKGYQVAVCDQYINTDDQ